MIVTETIVKFNIERKKFTQKVEFKIYTNLPKIKGMRIEDAIDNWAVRTKEYTAESLCVYVMSKELPDVFCLTEEHYNKIIKEIEEENKTKNPQNVK
jgi:hypothetical protein